MANQPDSNVSINTWSGGLNMDVHPTKTPGDCYIDALNIHVLSQGNSTSAIVENEKGNRELFSIPSTSPLYHLGFLLDGAYQYNLNSHTYNLDITIITSAGVVLSKSYSLSSTQNTGDLYSLLVDSITGFGNLIASNNVKIRHRGDMIVFSTYNSNVTLLQTTDIISSTTAVTLTPVVPILSNPAIIGIYSMRDELVVFTTDTIVTGYGQIWKCKFDSNNYDIDGLVNNYLDESVHLFYKNNLNFSINNRIIDCITKYENIYFGKVWFTDDNNVLRNINLYDTNCYSLNPSELSIVPDFDQNKPIIGNINANGHYGPGRVEYAIQCYNKYNNLSSISRSSRLISLVASDEGLSDSGGYIGNPSNQYSYKQVQVNVTADTNYDICRLIAIRYQSISGTPEIRIVQEQNISGDGSLIFYDDGNNTVSTLTEAEYNALTSTLFSCKNILEKDNLLLAANIKDSSFDIDFDARCVRYKHDNTTYISNFDTSEEADDINPYNDFNVAVYGKNRYVFQKDNNPGGGTGKRIFGGTGRDQFGLGIPNIEYSFQMVQLDNELGDVRYPGELRCLQNAGKRTFPSNLNVANQDIIDVPNEVNNSFFSYKSPYISGLLEGYQRDEVYPFSIVFFDKKGRQSFSKWIGDIRMPKMSDYDDHSAIWDNGSSTGYKIADYTYNDGSSNTHNYQKVYALYPEFTVNLPQSILDQISGFSIVRCKREGKDRTILGQGISVGHSYTTAAQDVSTDHDQFGSRVRSIGTIDDVRTINGSFEFVSPEYSFNNNLTFVDNDRLDVVGLFDEYQAQYWNDPSGSTLGTIKKYNNTLPIDNEQFYTNYEASVTNGIDGTTELISSTTPAPPYWVKGLLVNQISSPFPTVYNYNGNQYFNHIPILNYRRNQSNRYGGNTLNNRANRSYISCGNFVKAENMTNNSTYYQASIGVTGGDTFVTYFDWFKGDSLFGMGHPSSPLTVHGCAAYIPLESSINCDLRYDPCTSRLMQYDSSGASRPLALTGINQGPYTISGASITFQTGSLYGYNSAYSRESDIIKFFPKPLNFEENLVRDCEIRNSGTALVGDQIDEWTVWKENDYTSVNAEHGAINDLKLFNNNVYFIQDNALGMISINERQETVDSTGSKLILGTGDTLGRFGYITTTSGTKHKSSSILADGIYYYDVNRNKFFVFTGQADMPLTDIKGLHTLFQSYTNYGSINTADNLLVGSEGIIGCYDKINNRIIFTLFNKLNSTSQDPLTISYNALLGQSGAFESKYSFASGLYHCHNGKFLSLDSVGTSGSNTCMIHNENVYGRFNGSDYDSYIEFISNSSPMVNKEFNNIEWDSYIFDETTQIEQDNITISTLQCSNTYQDSNVVTMLPDDNVKRRLRSWRCYIPRNWDFVTGVETDERLKDKYLKIKFTFHNGYSLTNNFRFWLYDVITKFIPQNL